MGKIRIQDTDAHRIDLAPTAFALQFKIEEAKTNHICQIVETSHQAEEILGVEKVQANGDIATVPYIVVLREEEGGVVTFTLDDAEHPALGSHDAWK